MRFLEKFVLFLEWTVAVLLGILSIESIAVFGATLVRSGREVMSGAAAFRELLDELFVLFIIIELFRMTFAYLKRTRVLPVAFEAVLIAVAREIVVLDYTADGVAPKLLALAGIVVAVALSWRLMAPLRPAPKSGEH